MKKLYLATLTLLISANVLASNFDFNAFDVDQDGLISLEEAKVDSTLSALFTELDSNQDGYLSLAEMTEKPEK